MCTKHQLRLLVISRADGLFEVGIGQICCAEIHSTAFSKTETTQTKESQITKEQESSTCVRR